MAKKRAGQPAVPADPKTLFMTASCYAFSWQLLNEHTGLRLEILRDKGTQQAKRGITFIPTHIPSVVVAAFSLEIYLKCLMLLCSVPLPHDHALEALFTALPGATRAEVKWFYDEGFRMGNFAARLPAAAPDGSSLDPSHYEFGNVLFHASNAFKEWRYFYESKMDGKWSICEGILIYALEKAILRMKPDWQEILDSRGALPVMYDPHA